MSHTSDISIGFLKSFLSTWWVDVRPLACSNHLPLSGRYVTDADLIRQRMVHVHPARAPAGLALRGWKHNTPVLAGGNGHDNRYLACSIKYSYNRIHY